MPSTNRTSPQQPLITVPFFTDAQFNYNIREFDKHPIVWADKDYQNLFNDFDKRILKQHVQADKDIFLREILNPCDVLITKELYSQQMGEESLGELLEETGTEYAFPFPDDVAFEQLCFTISSGAMNQLNNVAAFLDYKQLGTLITEYPIPVKVVLHALPSNLSLTEPVKREKDLTPVNVFEDIHDGIFSEYCDRFDYQTTFELEDDKKVTARVYEFYF